MNCASCQHANSPAARFCESCGSALARACSGCGEPLSPGARFCAQCGQPAEGAAASPASAPPKTVAPAAGERRLLTAMFCDLVGSTELSQRIDAEELGALIATYQGVCAEGVAQFDGHIAQFLGDGVLVYFGYPRAHEDDAERAIRAALAIQASLASIKPGRLAARAPEIAARIGIHTGPVVVSTLGSDARQETLALGETVNIAARLDALGEPGGIVVSDETLRLAPGLFVTRELGSADLKGVMQPIRVHAVERALGVSVRDSAARVVTPLIGRERELGLLLERWEEAQAGRGQVVTLSGEPGIGKSRMLRALREEIASQPHSSLDMQCSPYSTSSAFQPAIELFERGLAFADGDAPAARLAKLEQSIAQLPGLDSAEVVPYLAALLGLPKSQRFPLRHTSGEMQREQTLRALTAPILAMESLQPALVVFEDLHWSDPSTLDLIGRLIDQAPTLRLLLVLTFRPSFKPPWPLSRSYVSPLALSRLGRRATEQVIEACAGKALPPRVLEDVSERADGVPLFAEELAHAIVSSGIVVANGERFELRGRIADLSIPTTLQSSLMARLDRLGGAKQIAQIGATLGREFSYALIEAVADLPATELRRGLKELAAAEVLYRRGEPPDATYTFKHALIQDTAYESQLKSRRRELHARTANALAEHFATRVAAEPQQMAHHCAEGGLALRAIEHYALAGKQAIARLANPEAADYFGRALELLAQQPESIARTQREIELRIALAGPLEMHGDDNPQLAANLDRLAALCEQLEPGPARVPALVGLASLHQRKADLTQSGRWAAELLEVANALESVPLQLAGHAMLAAAAPVNSNMEDSCMHFARVLALAAIAEPPPPSSAFDVDLLAGLCGTHAMGLVLTGKPARAMERIEQGLSRARSLGHPHTLTLALSTSAQSCYFLEDYERTLALADECLAVSHGRGFSQLEASALVLAGWARVARKDSAGEETLLRGIAIMEHGGSRRNVVPNAAAAETALALGKLAEAHAAVDQVEKWVGMGTRSAWEKFPHLLRGELLIAAGGDLAEAEQLLLESIAGWQRLRAPWMELRSALALGEIALRTGEKAPARARLAALYARFSEGFETRRLREARRLLGELA